MKIGKMAKTVRTVWPIFPLVAWEVLARTALQGIDKEILLIPSSILFGAALYKAAKVCRPHLKFKLDDTRLN